MPQINRIRVNNVKYNFGTQYYDDFVMKLSTKNTIYDLANGGGKSVLMLLLMQNMIPNCTLDDKQPIEKLFRQGNDNTTIHSLIEWKLDACNVENGYQYMTTGFCARKGREPEAENQPKKETANVEYFNYCIFYRGYGEHDIRNLPLTKDGERVTYNGLKTFLRDLEKKDFGVSVHIFERKGDYQSFITRYGIYESQWEIVRGINRTEGHVRAYFETNYKTTRKVIEDLLIEGIIEKSHWNKIGEDDDSGMAETLLRIKDQLLVLAKRRGEIGHYETQMKLLSDFADSLEAFRRLYENKAGWQNRLMESLVYVRGLMANMERSLQEGKETMANLGAKLTACEALHSAYDIGSRQKEVDELEQLIREQNEKLAALEATLTSTKERLRLYEAASVYEDYRNYEKQLLTLKEQNAQQESSHEEMIAQLAKLAAAKWEILEPRCEMLSREIEERRLHEAETTKAREELEELQLHEYGWIHEKEGACQQIKTIQQDLDEELNELLAQLSLVSSAGLADRRESLFKELKQYEQAVQEISSEIDRVQEDRVLAAKKYADCQAKQQRALEELEKQQAKLCQIQETAATLKHLQSLYSEDNLERLRDDLRHRKEEHAKECTRLSEKIEQLSVKHCAISGGHVPLNTTRFQSVLDYLQSHYTGVCAGQTYLESLEVNEAGMALAKCPILPFAIVVEESAQAILADAALRQLELEGLVVPILTRSTLLESSWGDVVAVYTDMSYLYDEAKRNATMRRLEDDMLPIKEELARKTGHLQVLEDDLSRIEAYLSDISLEEMTQLVAQAMKECQSKEQDTKSQAQLAARYNDSLTQLGNRMAAQRARLKEIQTLLMQADQAKALLETLEDLNAQYGVWQAELKEASSRYHEEEARKKKLVNEAAQDHTQALDKETLLYELRTQYEEGLGRYARPGVDGVHGLSEEEIDAKANALLSTLAGTRLEDAEYKESLANAQAGCKKAIGRLRYYGMELSQAASNYQSGLFPKADLEMQLQISQELEQLREQAEMERASIEACYANKNRLEGAIAHAISTHTSQYGEYEAIACDDYAMAMHHSMKELANLEQQQRSIKEELRELETSNKDLMLKEHDLARMVKSAGLTIPQAPQMPLETMPEREVDFEKTQKEYDRLLKEENQLKDRFAQTKSQLMEALRQAEAFELAEELQRSLVLPEKIADVDMLVQGVSDTNDCIRLERDNIEQSIVDMTRIKESFEERCLQICSNIRTELERLPKLSTITLDDGEVPMITLNIPYIKEEFYKDRMSAYINDTIAKAELLGAEQEKLKYIRNMLSWKKLFAVIVTDMNSIRLCLYKREHMKEQSRYLRYEEAVGSTGQSQGIYIQFLVAVIHYISSINALGQSRGVIGETIFIDNPFGAAKDVYIWEPIFKLLKTNHVQLIVPARGATPAITAMFEVNYILGQNMVGKRLQTVVVDYHSQVETSEMDYEVMEYEQATFHFE